MKSFKALLFFAFLLPKISQAAWPVSCQLRLLGKIADYENSNFQEFSEGRKGLKELSSLSFKSSNKMILRGLSVNGNKCSASILLYKIIGPIPEGCPDYSIDKITSDCK